MKLAAIKAKTWRVSALAGMLGLAGCGVIYTVPNVDDGMSFGVTSSTEYDVEVIRLSHETAAAANLTPYVPPRLPLAFSPDAVAKIAGKTPRPPTLAPIPQPAFSPERRPPATPDRFPPRGQPQPYRIGISDELLLSVNTAGAGIEALPGLISAQSKRQGYVVQDDGSIAVPDAGRIRVAGRTLEQAEADIFQALVRAGIDPSFSLEVTGFNSQRVSVSGDVGSPSLIPIGLKPLYLHEAVNLAGGPRGVNPKIAKVQLIRGGQTFQIGVDRFLRDPEVRNVVLRDGDSIFVGSDFNETAAQSYFQEQLTLRDQQLSAYRVQFEIEQLQEQRRQTAAGRLNDERALFRDRLELGAVKRDYAYLTGEVGSLRIPLPFEQTASLADALFDNTRISINTADFGAIYVLRPSNDPATSSGLTAYHLNADNAANLAVATQFQLRPNDVVFIAEQPVTSWNRAISQVIPSLIFTVANASTGGSL